MRLAHKQQLIIVQHDGGFRSESAFATLQQAVNAAHESHGQTAVGIATLLGFEDACAEIKVRSRLARQPEQERCTSRSTDADTMPPPPPLRGHMWWSMLCELMRGFIILQAAPKACVEWSRSCRLLGIGVQGVSHELGLALLFSSG